ncbi:T9SS type A sorting domain-containing protein [Acidiluteibacter ferrifornacis]|uniref:T9SS type A sorting domain-containing protein n=1 Tax=Acidiluteibacter ferrifornacis TaxID=2692424 RepID=A0A6N9NQJ0_9FLAO|nr:T9SS type A sorting domain-containing protein [Acidiluteibacter ferrifornacis]NBG67347.1 T9SS type A sorting domain-containing protein [Acidiluteibacter ferrifornacis]
MKKLLLIASFLVPFGMIAQTSGGPDNFGYTWKSSAASGGPTYAWYDISTIGTQVNGLGDDNVIGPFPLSSFTYYTAQPTSFYVGSNGYISFSSVNIASVAGAFPIIPTVGGPNNFIAALLCDLSFASSGNPGRAYYYDNGDSVCVSFINVPFWINNSAQYGGSNTFQIILNKLDTSITVNYQSQTGSPDPTYTANGLSIGIENSSGTDGLQQYRGMVFPTANTSVKYYYPNIVAPLTDASANWVGNTSSAGEFVLQGQVLDLKTNVKNTGNQTIPTLTANGTVTPPVGGTPLNTSKSIANLAAGKDSTITYNTPYTFTQLGAHSYRTNITGVTGDNTPSNNSLTQKIIALNPVSDTIKMDYTDGVSTGSIGWSGGNGGTAVYMSPPIYPARILSTEYYITALGTPAVGFHAMIFDDDGPNGTHGTLLDSVYVAPGSLTINSYASIKPNDTNITITSGGVYIHWLMDGDGINIGTSTSLPISKRAIEVISGSWADYRDQSTQDFMMGMTIATPSEDGEVTSIGRLNGKAVFTQRVRPYPLTAKISNIGFRNATNVTVQNKQFTNSGIQVGTGSKVLATLNAGRDTTFTFSNTFTPSIAGTYSYHVYLNKLLKDNELDNDTMIQEIIVVDTNLSTINASYANATSEGSVANASSMMAYAVYFKPPYASSRIKKTSFYHTALGGAFGFDVLLYKADGPNGMPGTVLDSVLVGSGNITTNTYIDVTPSSNNVLVDSNGFYVVWRPFGNGITLGVDQELPFSKNTYQLDANGYAPYVNNNSEDLMIKVQFENGTVPVGVEEQTLEKLSVYPNPFNNFTTIALSNSIDGNVVNIEIRDIKGQIVSPKVIKYQDKILVFKGHLPQGQYIYQLNSNGKIIAKGKLTMN